MKDAITQILTDTDARSDAQVEQTLVHQAEIASPWAPEPEV